MNRTGNNGSEKAFGGLFLMGFFRYHLPIGVWNAYSDLSEQVMFLQDAFVFVA